jgi:hypothetical protein
MEANKKSNSENNKPKYTCPMHPEVKSDVQGKCPKCGMDLVKSDSKNIRLK